jgi:hypothetical protein
MIWSLIKLLAGCVFMLFALLGNIILWLTYFGWNKEYFTFFWTDKEELIQYYYHGNILGWAFQVKRLADKKYDLKVVD